MQLFNPYGHDNLFTVLHHNSDEEWKEVRKAFSKSMSTERIRCRPLDPPAFLLCFSYLRHMHQTEPASNSSAYLKRHTWQHAI